MLHVPNAVSNIVDNDACWWWTMHNIIVWNKEMYVYTFVFFNEECEMKQDERKERVRQWGIVLGSYALFDGASVIFFDSRSD